MTQSRTKRIVVLLVGGLFVSALAAGGFWARAAGVQGEKSKKVGIPHEQVISSIRTAVAAKPGDVLEMEAEKERGKVICEVEILAQDGKTYEVAVDVASNTVLEIEEEDDEDEDDDDNDDDN